ncbi:cytochrome P450 [Hyaloscypha variabilis F]|uniref:Cytochrome P450 n=1 Tax=Hyaloscypha variabilis (strain UAMH 11265 / GT02V1 / F) TaxID=1149755 RepID=A0A2J6QSV0_HYAVF|nr:cytochrome P450 [Hyaloscypha variabilis F]
MMELQALPYRALISCLVLVLLYNVGNIIYDLFFHPIKRYPGPRIAAASRIPLTYNLLRGRAPQWIRSLHEKYGNVVRVAPDELSYRDLQGWKDIYGSTQAAKYGMKRSDDFFAYFFDKQSTEASIVSASEENHHRMRKIFSRAFSKPALAAQEPLIISHVDLLIQKLKKAEAANQVVNMVDMHSFVVFDIFADLMFGESLHLLEDADSPNASWVKSVPGYIAASIVLGALAKFAVFRLAMAVFIPSVAAKHYKKFLQSTSEKVDVRLSLKEERSDIMHYLSSPDEKLNLSRPEIDSAALVLMIAGSDTTPSILIGLTYLLLSHGDVLRKLVEEIRSSFDSDASINLESISKLPYLGACIDEGFRVYPSAPIGFPREVPAGGAPISGGWVPEGTTVYVTPLAAYSSTANFHNPESFIPERWLPESGAFSADEVRDVVQPFSMGPRDCLGRT